MFDLRYHVASLAAVFLALVIGILLGVGISGRGLVDKSELLHRRAEELGEERFRPAVFEDAGALRAAREQDLAERERRRQARRDSLVKRGKLLVKADPQQFSHLTRRT